MRNTTIKKLVLGACVLFALAITSQGQPGNGNGNGNGNRPCTQPPCGGPNQQVPIDETGLIIISIAFGVYRIIKQIRQRNAAIPTDSKAE